MLVAKELISLGADVNIAMNDDISDTEELEIGCTPLIAAVGCTPLTAAAGMTHNLELVLLLLRKGAIKQPEFSFEYNKDAKQIMKIAEDQIKKEKLFLAAYVKPENQESIIQTLPPDLAKYLFEFIKN